MFGREDAAYVGVWGEVYFGSRRGAETRRKAKEVGDWSGLCVFASLCEVKTGAGVLGGVCGFDGRWDS